MHRPVPASSYAAVLRIPGVLRPFAAVNLGRLSYAALPLSILITVQQATASFATAGLALGVLSAATGLMPLKSRLVDRFGARRVLPPLAVLFAAALCGLAAAAAADVGGAGPYVALAGVAGLTTPPLGPSMRALWAALAPDAGSRQRAYALDGVAEESVRVAGPLAVAAVLLVAGAPVTLVLAGALNVAGAVGLARSAVAGRTEPTSSRRPLRGRRFGALVLVVLGIGVGSAPLTVGIVARADELDAPWSAALLLAALSAGSVIGGLLWGVRRHRRSPAVQLAGLTLVLAAGCIAMGFAPSPVLIGVGLLGTGLALAPVQIVAYLTADRIAPAGNRTEATAWVSTAHNVGGSVGVTAGGFLVDVGGGSAATSAGGLVLVLVAAATLIGRTRLR